MSKQTIRRAALERRRARSEADRRVVAEALAAHIGALPEVVRARAVGCYLSAPSEPGTGPLLNLLDSRGVRVLVPVARDGAMTWAAWTPEAAVGTGVHGVPEPTGPAEADIAEADLLLVPGLAVDAAGRRLGRGGGYYDRLLADLHVPTCVLLFADEIVDEVPVEPHDRPVDMVATELGVSHLGLTA